MNPSAVAETIHMRPGEGPEVVMPLPNSERRKIETYLAFRRAGFSHALALRWSR